MSRFSPQVLPENDGGFLGNLARALQEGVGGYREARDRKMAIADRQEGIDERARQRSREEDLDAIAGIRSAGAAGPAPVAMPSLEATVPTGDPLAEALQGMPAVAPEPRSSSGIPGGFDPVTRQFAKPLAPVTLPSGRVYDAQGQMDRRLAESLQMAEAEQALAQRAAESARGTRMGERAAQLGALAGPDRPELDAGMITAAADNDALYNAIVERALDQQGVGGGSAYEERAENGGVAIYENGRFKAWKTRPPSERPGAASTEEQRRFQRERGLADDFRAEQDVKDAKGVAGAVTTIRAALRNSSPQGDLAAIYALVKLYDPGSVVREGEIALTQSAASLPEQVRRMWSGWNSGRKLTDQMRADLASIADSIVGERESLLGPTLERYGGMAREWGVDSAAVAPNPFTGLRSSTVTTSTGRTFKRVTP